MPFERLSDRLGSLPLVLAGPILRRVEANQITVFLVLRSARTVTLRVFDPSIDRATPIAAGTSATSAMGKNLHVVSVRASSENAFLKPGQRYVYNLYLREEGKVEAPLDAPNLTSQDVLVRGNPAKAELQDRLLYETPTSSLVSNLPSFIAPPISATDLRVVHASCRKPHGEGQDMLHYLDTLIENADTRPHMLFLTGDQIYADDVADPLLYMLRDASDALLAWQERLPIIDDGVISPAQKRRVAEALWIDDPNLVDHLTLQGRMKPGKRQVLADRLASFSSSAAASHLFSLGEFYSMYLFTWSNLLWPDLSKLELEAFFEAVYDESLANVGGVESSAFKRFSEQMTRLNDFFLTIKKVRRALANIPVYMIFDDHEITDDWFAHLRWTQDVLRSALGKRVILNGMAAYAIFQHWGNAPEQFAAGKPGAELLSLLQWGKDNATVPPRLHDDAQVIHTIFGIPEPGELYNLDNGTMKPPSPEKAFMFHYTVDGPPDGRNKHGYRFHVLNTRTRRRFPIKHTFESGVWMAPRKNPPELLSAEALDEQMPKNTAACPLNFVIVPSPLRSIPHIEFWLAITAFFGGELKADYESWALQPAAVERLLDRCALLGKGTNGPAKALIFNGDVHYGFASRLTFQNRSKTSSKEAVIAHFTASSLHNQTNDFPSTIEVQSDGYGWSWQGRNPATFVSTTLEESSYKAEFVSAYGIVDSGTPAQLAANSTTSIEDYAQLAKGHREKTKEEDGIETVGYNNIALIQVKNKPDMNQLDAVQELFWKKNSGDELRTTLYSVPLVFRSI